MNHSPARPRVLLVEDDASLQRFVALALDEMDIELLLCGDVDTALNLLAQNKVQLILSDLMMPGRSGFELIEALNARPDLRGDAKLVVFSAGLTPSVRQRLDGLQVWRLLSKPCSVAALEACVSEGVGLDKNAVPTPVHAPDPGCAAIAQHFGGNAALYQTFRASCLQQFAADLAIGDLACAQADAPALRRLVHSLKSVLFILGYAEASDQARRLEDLAAHLGQGADWPIALVEWQRLRAAVARLR
jgi:CheY-like chemotaxis protein